MQVQKGLSAYLETKRNIFARFYFLSDDELLEILSQTKDPTAVQPHMRKCFDNISKLKFEDDLQMSRFQAADGESVAFCEALYPKGGVEDWLLEVERVMMVSLRGVMSEALQAYAASERTEFVKEWPGMIVIAACQTMWTAEVEEAINAGPAGLKGYSEAMTKQLLDLVALVRGKLSKIQRKVIESLIVIEVGGGRITYSQRVCSRASRSLPPIPRTDAKPLTNRSTQPGLQGEVRGWCWGRGGRERLHGYKL